MLFQLFLSSPFILVKHVIQVNSHLQENFTLQMPHHYACRLAFKKVLLIYSEGGLALADKDKMT